MILLWASALAGLGWAQVTDIGVKEKRWSNDDCASSRGCDLKEVRFRARDYKVLIDGSYSYGSALSAHYRTDSNAALERYAFVQFIRGCTFESKLENGRMIASYQISREFFGKFVPFLHPRRVVDSVDVDPVYNSDPELGRHYLYQWNRVPGSVQRQTRVFYGKAKPPTPELYVLDHPGTAFSLNGELARSLSLEFKTCLYRTSDVPTPSAPEADLPGALICFDWASSFIYNHATKAYETWTRLHPACLVEASAVAAASETAPLEFDGRPLH